jgi:hypothetical protein
MGILDFAEEAAGAFAGDKALEAVDPNAGLLAKAAAAVAGFEGVSMLKEHMGQSSPQDTDDAAAGDPDDSNAQA